MKQPASDNSLIIVTTKQCNCRCRPCPLWQSNESISFKTIKRALDLYCAEGTAVKKNIRFFGGEPLLQYPLLTRVFTCLKKYPPINTQISTNAVLLDKQKIDFFSRFPLLELSLNSYTSNKIDKRTISYALDKIKTVTLNFLITPDNVWRLSQQFQILLKQGITRFNFLPAYYFLWDEHQLNQLEMQLNKISRHLLDNNSKREIYLKNLHQSGEVSLYNTGFVIDCNGDIYLNNLFLAKDFMHFKPLLRSGNIHKIENFNQIKENRVNPEDIVKATLRPDIILVNRRLDAALNQFLSNLNN